MSMRQRQEIQKMSRRYGIIFLLAASLNAAVFPEQFGSYQRVNVGSLNVADKEVWNEYGLLAAEHAEFQSGDRKVAISLWQLKDTTGAFAAAQWLQPDAIQHGNYVLKPEGPLAEADLKQLESRLPKVDRTANPGLPSFLAAKGKVANSERYVLGAASLAKFEPRVPADLAGFTKGAEGQLAKYKIQGGEASFLLLSYPTPQIAGDRYRQFEKRQDMKARRHGPMVAVVLDAPPEQAEKLLSSVTYQPAVNWTERVYNPKKDNPGEMILAICILAGALMLASLVLGLMFGGLRQVFGSKFGVQSIDDNFTSLHISDK